MKIDLYPYQIDCIEAVKRGYRDGISRQMIALPTGSGKTIIMSSIAKEFNCQTFIFAHRNELVVQTRDKLKAVWPESDIGIMKAELNDYDHQIIIGSVQSCSQNKRLSLLKDKNIQLMMIDEAHHSFSKSYQKIIKELGFENDKNKLLIGVTATPERADRQPLGKTFQQIVYNKPISELIESGYLTQIISRKILTLTSIEKVKNTAGDFNNAQLENKINNRQRNVLIVEKYILHGANRKAIAFCVSVKHIMNLVAVFKEYGVNAQPIWGDMDEIERKNRLEEFALTKNIHVLVSCGVLTEGFDEPSVECILMARPTQSTCLYTQMIGRGLRVDKSAHATKKDCLILDFMDKYHKIDGVMRLSDVVPHKLLKKFPEREGHTSIDNDNDVDVSVEELSDSPFDLIEKSKIYWIPLSSQEFLLAGKDDEEILIEQCSGSVSYNAIFYKKINKKKGSVSFCFYKEIKIVENCPSFEEAMLKSEEFAQKHLDISSFIKVGYLQQNKTILATESQKDLLKRLKSRSNLKKISKSDATVQISSLIARKNIENRLNTHESSKLIPASWAQKYALDALGEKYPYDISKFEAHELISAHFIEKNLNGSKNT